MQKERKVQLLDRQIVVIQPICEIGPILALDFQLRSHHAEIILISQMKPSGFGTYRSTNARRQDPASSGFGKLYESKNSSYGYDPHYEKLEKVIPNTHKNSVNKYPRMGYLSPTKLGQSKYEKSKVCGSDQYRLYSKNFYNSQKLLPKDPVTSPIKKMSMNSRQSLEAGAALNLQKRGYVTPQDLYNSSVSQYKQDRNRKEMGQTRYRKDIEKISENPSTASINGSDIIDKDCAFEDSLYSDRLNCEHLTKSFTHQMFKHKDLNDKPFFKNPRNEQIKDKNPSEINFNKLNLNLKNLNSHKRLEHSKVQNIQTDRVNYEVGFLKKKEVPVTRSRQQTKNFLYEEELQQLNKKDKGSLKLIPKLQKLQQQIDDLKNDISVLSTRHPSLYTPAQRKFSIKDFKLGKCLGEGRFGKVYRGIHKQTGTLVALKKISKEMIKNNSLQNQFALQVRIQTYINHPNVVKLFGVLNQKEDIYLILEHMEEGSLYQYLKNRGELLSEKEVAFIIKETVSAIRYLHDLNIAHRDIKPQNILLSHGVCKLGDFGWATICDERRKTNCGTLDYYAPEILQGKEYDESIDLWCIGVLTFELLTGKMPFYHASKRETVKKIIKVEKMDFPSRISQSARNFTEALLVKEPTKRLNINKLLTHAFIAKNCEERL